MQPEATGGAKDTRLCRTAPIPDQASPPDVALGRRAQAHEPVWGCDNDLPDRGLHDPTTPRPVGHLDGARARERRVGRAASGSSASSASIRAKMPSTFLASRQARSSTPRIFPIRRSASAVTLKRLLMRTFGMPVCPLHPVGEIDIGVAHRAESEDEIGVRGDHPIENGLVAAPSQSPCLGKVALARGKTGR